MALVALSAPLFVLRVPGTGFSLVDMLISAGVLLVAVNVVLHPRWSARRLLPVQNVLVVGVIFLSLCCFSGVTGNLTGRGEFAAAEFLSGFLQYTFLMVLVPLTSCWYLNRSQLWTFVRALGIGFFVPCVLGIAAVSGVLPLKLENFLFVAGRATGTFGNANSFAAVLNIMLPGYLILAFTDRGLWRALGVFELVSAVLSLVMTASFGGVLVAICVLAANLLLIMLWRRHPFRRHAVVVLSTGPLLVALVIGSLALLLVTYASRGRLADRIERGTALLQRKDTAVRDLGSAGLRLQLASEALDMVLKRQGGMWGHGLRQSAPQSSYGCQVHVTYLLLWIEGGIWLLVVYAVFLVLLLFNIMRLASVEPEIGLAMGLAWLAVVLLGLMNAHLYLRHFWIPLLPAFVDWRCRVSG